MNRPLSEIIKDFETDRLAYREFTKKGVFNKNSLLEFQGKFVDLKAEIAPWKKYLAKEWTRRDDKAATAIKFRIATSIANGDFIDNQVSEDSEPTVFDKKMSITQAEKYASGCQKYKEFVDQRAFYRESLTNVADLREDLNSYINEIKDRLKE